MKRCTLDTAQMALSKDLAGLPGGGITRRRVSRKAYMEALKREGPAIATEEGESWWRDQERRNPFIMAGGRRPDGTDSPNGHTCKWGRVKEKYVAGRGWFRWENGGWVAK